MKLSKFIVPQIDCSTPPARYLADESRGVSCQDVTEGTTKRCGKIFAMPDNVNPRMLESAPMQRCCLGECRAACCLYGVWIDAEQAKELQAHADLIAPHMAEDRRDPSLWFDGREDLDEFTPSGRVVHSTVLDDPSHYGGTSCVFLRPDHKCALQVAGEAAGFHPWHFKPFYCILHPLDLDDRGRITLDRTDLLLEETASCLRPADHPIPLAETFQPELSYFLGEEEYREMAEKSQGAPRE